MRFYLSILIDDIFRTLERMESNQLHFTTLGSAEKALESLDPIF